FRVSTNTKRNTFSSVAVKRRRNNSRVRASARSFNSVSVRIRALLVLHSQARQLFGGWGGSCPGPACAALLGRVSALLTHGEPSSNLSVSSQSGRLAPPFCGRAIGPPSSFF